MGVCDARPASKVLIIDELRYLPLDKVRPTHSYVGWFSRQPIIATAILDPPLFGNPQRPQRQLSHYIDTSAIRCSGPWTQVAIAESLDFFLRSDILYFGHATKLLGLWRPIGGAVIQLCIVTYECP